MKTNTVKHIAQLSNIPITESEAQSLQVAFDETLATVANLQDVDVTGVEPTHQVTGLENVLRDDVIDDSRTFSQDEALANAKESYNGYFVVPRIIED